MDPTSASSESILRYTAEIVSAHVSRNDTPTDSLPDLITQVHKTLMQIGQEAAEPPAREPAVPVKKSVFQDHIVCLECGKSFRTMKRHLMVDHNISEQEYRERFSLPQTYPLVAPQYSEIRSSLAKKIGLGKGRNGHPAARKASAPMKKAAAPPKKAAAPAKKAAAKKEAPKKAAPRKQPATETQVEAAATE